MIKQFKTFTECEDCWYALFVKTGEESKILESLANLHITGLQFHVPKRELIIRRHGAYTTESTVMFPGYILVHGNLTQDGYAQIKQIQNVFTWIHDENGPLVIDKLEIIILRRLLDSQDTIRISKVYYEGEKIVVVDGPLLGNEGTIRKIDKRNNRAKISISIFGNERMVDISIENISVMTEYKGVPD